MSLPHYDLDVRPILRGGGEPFSAIMEAVAMLAPGQGLRLFATFKPLPLFQVLGARGFEPSAREIGGGDWEVIFMPRAPTEQPLAVDRSADRDTNADWPTSRHELDCRDLEPPEPMVKTLERVESLGPGQTLVVLLPREPLFLFEELKTRGHEWRGGFEPEGHYRLIVRVGSSHREGSS